MAVSFPDLGTDMSLTLTSMNEIMGLEGTAAQYEAPLDERMLESHVESPNRVDRTLNVWQVRSALLLFIEGGGGLSIIFCSQKGKELGDCFQQRSE